MFSPPFVKDSSSDSVVAMVMSGRGNSDLAFRENGWSLD